MTDRSKTSSATPSKTPSATVANQNVSTADLIHDKLVRWLREEAQLDVKEVDFEAPFYDLGIDSLGAMSIAAELQTETHKIIDPEMMYDLENIRELAEYIDSLPVQQLPAQAEQSPPSNSAPACVCSNTDGTDPTLTKRTTPGGPPPDPMKYFQQRNRRVMSLKEQGLYFFESVISEHDGAWVVADGQRMLMLGSYEYLGLLGHKSLNDAAVAAVKAFGTGHHGSRLLTGTTTIHKQLEAKLAAFMAAEDAIVFSSGYVTNLATISALVGPGDYVIGDQWNHASIADGCHMSGADFVTFQHNDVDSLAECLDRIAGRRTLVVVDAVFSMDGDIINLPPIVALCKKHGALLMVDEAHSIGVLGKTGHGLQELYDLPPDAIDVKMGTLSKTLAGSGGFVAGCDQIVTYLRHHARGYIFSGALSVSHASVAIAALEVIEREPELVQRLWENVHHYVDGLKSLGFETGASVTPIVPIMTHNDATAIGMTQFCRQAGLLVIPVCFPAVPMDAPRLRTCVSSVHSTADIDFALEVLAKAGKETGLIT